jgi:hypothetical protein
MTIASSLRHVPQWAFFDVYRLWVAVAVVAVPLLLARNSACAKEVYVDASLFLQLAGAVLTFKSVSGSLGAFAKMHPEVLTIGLRFSRWWKRAPWTRPEAITGTAMGVGVSLVGHGHLRIDTSSLPTDQRLKALEDFVGNLSEANAATHRAVAELRTAVAEQVADTKAKVAEVQAHTVDTLTNGAAEQILGIWILAVGGVFGTRADRLAEGRLF